MTTSAAQHAPAPAGSRRGLTVAEAARRLEEYGRNEVTAARAVPLYARVLTQLRDALILVLLGAVVLTLAVGDHADAVVIALVIVVNTAVGVAQEVRADNAVAALSALSAPNARVLRDFAPGEVPAAEVVPGDVLILGEGDIVVADAELAEASALLVDESMLTGESVPVDEDSGARLSAGTVVARGRGVATVTATGTASALAASPQSSTAGGSRLPCSAVSVPSAVSSPPSPSVSDWSCSGSALSEECPSPRWR
ncbi:cation-transporting P-type ATPase [Streptomyces sp. NPDC058175]|uniref:P-type ATPase n=1 Tax=Streptomyces sp. NPDC058175 TaxID=3346367 RepID=UPI0036E3B421